MFGHVQVTTVTDALGNVSKTHFDGSGRTVKSIRFESPGSQDSILTQFTYDGIGRLVEVLDADSNVTVSEYDMGDRRVRVSHPASGETTFTYDVLGNVLTRQTANLRDSSLFIVYGYDRGRLVSVSYPEHPENNVEYYYGDVNNGDQAKGRLCFRRDATGGEQYGYDNLGNVCLRLRTVTVPNEDVGTFQTEFEYDSYGKLLSMTYPDGELVCYWYDGSGQLTEVYESDRLLGDRYVKEIGYDEFGDRVYMEYGNGAVSSYSYDSRTRRLSGLSVSKPGGFTLERCYAYDPVGNILSLTNSGTGLLYTPPVSHRYVYDGLYRLTEAYGNEDDPQTGYELLMSYDKMYRVTGKEQRMWQTNAQFLGTLNAGYKLSYTYDRSPGRRFRMSTVSDVNYRTAGAPEEGDHIGESHRYGYDHNGNLLHVNTRRVTADGKTKDLAREEKFRWDEENRLMAISQDGYVSNYWYDGDGERVIKEHGGNHAVFVNSAQDSVLTDTRQFTIYPSAYFVVHNGNWFTKHIYIGSERIASRMGSMRGLLSQAFVNRPVAGSSDNIEDLLYDDQCDMMALVMKSNYEYFDLPYNGQNRHDLNGAMVGTQPRGGSSGARYYWMLAGTEDADSDGGPSGAPRRGNKVDGEGNRYYYHSDHLGSSSLITNDSCNVTQQLDYLPYGEVFLEKRADVDYHTPYKFNGKELDEETGLYYYGARYMNPRLSIWYGVDPISNYDSQNSYHNLYGDDNNSEYNSYNTDPYGYCSQNPVRLIDPNGEEGVDVVDFVPFAGSGRDIYRGFRDGDWATGTIGALGLVFDCVTFGSASVVTGGIKAGIKVGVKSAVKQEVKQVVKAETKVTIKALTQASKHSLKSVSGFGIASYKDLYAQVVKKYGKSSGYEVHHLIEKRFARLFGTNSDDMASIVLTKEQHQQFTNAWRKMIGYANSKNPLRTDNATKKDVLNAAKVIYKDYPEILKALGL